MSREVLERDATGRPTVVAYAESKEERDRRIQENAVQAERAEAIAQSLRAKPASSLARLSVAAAVAALASGIVGHKR